MSVCERECPPAVWSECKRGGREGRNRVRERQGRTVRPKTVSISYIQMATFHPFSLLGWQFLTNNRWGYPNRKNVVGFWWDVRSQKLGKWGQQPWARLLNCDYWRATQSWAGPLASSPVCPALLGSLPHCWWRGGGEQGSCALLHSQDEDLACTLSRECEEVMKRFWEDLDENLFRWHWLGWGGACLHG